VHREEGENTVNCYVCTIAASPTVAVAACPNCGVGLCLEHRVEQAKGASGTAIECRHVVAEVVGARG
jgi:hypothetical protein